MGNLANLAVYNPAILDDADFLAGFVARRDLADNLLARLREIPADGLARHHLILGQRGMGKTTLLRRLAVGVRDDPRLASVLLPLTFREEQYNVHNLRVFWCNCLDALGDWFEASGREDEAAAIDREVATLCRGAADPDGQDILEAFRRWMRRLERRPLLLLDNVDLILHGLEKQHWSLRRAMQEPGGIVVVGASAVYLETTADPKAAFYDFFQVTVLEPLTAEELLSCLRRLADARGDAGRPVLHVLGTDPGRIRTLHALTGGNPRTLVILYLLLESEAGGDVMTDLERLLDQVTVLYKARVEDLAPQARVVLDAVALHWDPTTAAQAAEATGLDVTAVSSQLDRLVKAGILAKVEVSTTTRAAFQLEERFFNIWYLMRHGPRRQRTRLRWLTGFLQGFYSPGQLRERAKGMLRNGATQRPEQGDYCLALADAVDEGSLRNLLGRKARDLMEQFAREHGKRLEDLVDPAELPEPQTADDWYGMAWWMHVELGRYEEAEVAYRKVIEIDGRSAYPWNGLGNLMQDHLGRYEEAERAYRKAIEIDERYGNPWNNLGNLLQVHLGRYEEAERAYRKAIEIDGRSADPWNGLGNLLQDHLGRFGEAEEAYREAMKRVPELSMAHANLIALGLMHPGLLAGVPTDFDGIIEQFSPNGAALFRALRAVAHDDVPAATGFLDAVLREPTPEVFSKHWDDLLRVFRLAAQRGHGDALLAWMDGRGIGERFLPLRVAYDAFLYGEARLKDVNPEVRGAARRIFDWLDSLRRHAAGQAPEVGSASRTPALRKGRRP